MEKGQRFIKTRDGGKRFLVGKTQGIAILPVKANQDKHRCNAGNQ